MSLPEYEHPPVHEVVLGVHFREIERFSGPYIGLLWQEFRAQFEKIQEQAPLVLRIERFGFPEPSEPPQLEVLDALPPRIWFVKSSEAELLQVQKNWFSHNWRRVAEDDEYPRYTRIRASFATEMSKLVAFLEREQLGALDPLQCEVTYINHVPLGQGEVLEDLLTVYRPEFSDEFLKAPENANLALRFLIPDAVNPVGRLHVNALPVFLIKNKNLGYQLTLTMRGKPAGSRPDDIFSFFDIGHEWIVRGFTSITTAKMHERWGRIK